MHNLELQQNAEVSAVEKLEAIKALHAYSDAGNHYRTDAQDVIVGVEKMLWCDACGARFWHDEHCPTRALIELP